LFNLEISDILWPGYADRAPENDDLQRPIKLDTKGIKPNKKIPLGTSARALHGVSFNSNCDVF
jgi:hypothetical protein